MKERYYIKVFTRLFFFDVDDTKDTHVAKVFASCSSYPSEPGILLLQVRDLNR